MLPTATKSIVKEDNFSREVVIELKNDCIKVLTHFVEKIQEQSQLKFNIACCVSLISLITLVWKPDNIRKLFKTLDGRFSDGNWITAKMQMEAVL